MSLRILAIGDLHLGRIPGRLPPSLHSDAARLGPAGAWQRAVDLAIEESVTAVILAGDVTESHEDYFEALPILQTGAERLTAAGIQLVGIAGNHDGRLLPTLSQRVPGFKLLGEGGRWQSLTLEAGAEALTLWGWSFPDQHFSADPTRDFPGRSTTHPTLGLLHCHLDQVASPYAPVAAGRLRDINLDGWLLGHVHQPTPLTLPKPLGYLGSATGLHVGEAGPRGAWLLSVKDGRLSDLQHQPLAPLRWEHLDVDVSGVTDNVAVRDRFMERLERLSEALLRGPHGPRAVGLRVRLSGESDLPSTAFSLGEGDEASFPLPGAAHLTAFIESVTVEVRPTLPLTDLARRTDQPGLLARRLLVLDRSADDPERQALLGKAAAVAREAMNTGSWRRLHNDRLYEAPDAEQIARWLRQTAATALRSMLRQQGQGSA